MQYDPSIEKADPAGSGQPEPRAQWPRWVGYVATGALEAALTGGLIVLHPHFPLGGFPIPYILLMMLVAYVFGEGPGILAFFLGLFAFDYFFLPPLYSPLPHAETRMGWAALVAFLIGTVIVGISMTLIRRSKRRVQRALAQAEQEIAERARAEVALRETKEDLNRAQAVAHAGSWRLDVRHNVLRWSDEAYRIFGTPRGTPLTYETFLATVHPDDREYVDRKWKAALSGEPYDIEHRIVVDGEVKWVRERAGLEFDEQGTLLGGFGTVQDITDLRRAMQALRESEEHKLEFYRRTIMAATDGKLVLTDRPEIEKLAGPRLAAWEILSADDLTVVRHGVQDIARAAGMEQEGLGKFVVSIGEAATNALKHAGGGTASLHRTPDGLIVVVSDKGPGIAALALPEVALKRGYSTAGTLGMGYKVMISFSDRIYLATDPEGTTVAIEMILRPAEPALEAEATTGAIGSPA